MAIALSVAGCGPSQKELDLQAQVDKLKKEGADKDAQLAEEQKKYDDAMAELEKLGATTKDARAKLDELNKALAEYKARADQLAAIEARYRELRNRLEKLAKVGVKFAVRNNRMVIQLPGDVLFDSGKDELKKEGKEVLGQVADVIRNDSDLKTRTFQVAGHTDDATYPPNGPFKDNWGLSLARARQVLLFLVTPVDGGPKARGKGPFGGGLDQTKLSAAGFGETQPEAGAVGTQSEEDKKKNRRVELVLQPNVDEMLNLGNLH